MHILYLLTQDLESPSGLGRYFPLAKELTRMGHKVTIAALHSNYKSLHSYQEDREGVEILYVEQMHVLKQANQKQYFPTQKLINLTVRETLALGQTALKIPADIIHVGKPHPMNSLAGLAGKYLQGKILFVDCDDYETVAGNFSHNWQQSIIARFEKQMPFRVQLVTTNTFFMRDKLISWGVPENNIIYLPNGVDRERFNMQDQKQIEDLRKKLNLENKRVVAYIGTLGLASHAVDLLIDAFAIVLNSMPDSVLMMVGGGEDFQLLKAYSESLGLLQSIRWIGKVPPESIPLYYKLANATVDPVRDDDAARGRAPLKLFESWASGVPFVSADIGDRRLLLGDPPAGMLTQPSNPGKLAQAILKILSDEDLARSVCLSGMQRIQNYYWDRLSVQLNEIYVSASN